MRFPMLLALALALAAPTFADGDVTVFVDERGNVIVIGDGKDNDIVHEAEGDLAIRGRAGTTINGGTEPFLIPVPVTGSYFVHLQAGDDRFETSTVMTSDSEIRMGEGNDSVGIGNSVVPGLGLRIDTGAGDDFVDVQDSSFSLLRVFSGAGADEIQFFFAFADALQLHAGADDDVLSLDECAFDGTVTLFGGPGLDELLEGEVEYFGRTKIVSWEAPLGIL